MKAKEWHAVTINIPTSSEDIVSSQLFELGSVGVIEEARKEDALTLKAYFEATNVSADQVKTSVSQTLGDSLKGIEVTSVKIQNWADEWRQYFKPLEIADGIIIRPSWEEYTPKAGEIVITLDPGMAFGTGTHATTKLCAKATVSLLRKIDPKAIRLLDLGTGSGILAIIAAKMGVPEIAAVDIDDDSIEAAGENIAINQCDKVVSLNKDINIYKKGSFGVVIANIIYLTLVELREMIEEKTAKGGYLIMSGITHDQEENILKHYTSSTWTPIAKEQEDEWMCIVFRKN
jgi:ribosomal protein L11 methyltransferase